MSTVEEFRERALDWLGANAEVFADAHGADTDFAPTPVAAAKDFQARLFEAGFAGITWPAEYGGQGLGTEEQVAFDSVAAGFKLLNGLFTIGITNVGPTLLQFASEEQKKRFLPKMLSGQECWCQLFSEPRGGSDLASLQTKATPRPGGGWVLNGQKVWTSVAQHSDFGAILARTDPTVPKHQGITLFIVDMKHPGVTVRPLRVATGDSPFNEVFFDDVELDESAVVGEVNQGWSAAVVMLSHEHRYLGTGARRRSNPLGYAVIAELAAQRGLTREALIRNRLSELYARDAGLTSFAAVLAADSAEGVQIGARGSVGKLAVAEFRLWAGDVAQEVFGADLALGDAELSRVSNGVIASPAASIAGGTNEIQRNIVAERVLGLPKDPGVDRQTPFNQLKFG